MFLWGCEENIYYSSVLWNYKTIFIQLNPDWNQEIYMVASSKLGAITISSFHSENFYQFALKYLQYWCR